MSPRRYLAPQGEAMLQLQTDRVWWIGAEQRLDLREVTDHHIRNVEDHDSVRDRAALTREELASRLSGQMNSPM